MSRFLILITISFAISYGTSSSEGTKGFPWEECTSMDQIVGVKCDRSYFVCDFGDTWFTREVLCNNCVGDCPRGKVFDNSTEVCVLPNTIGCDCTSEGELLGTLCEPKYYVCNLLNGDWRTTEVACDPPGSVFDPSTSACRPQTDIQC